ncbi:uncharacterized protein F5Z01DRAFT_738180 [Emericellopsis atlantica]|uniref:Uncharacterized protein n=1 Tax=Emericellopsis atlantica TaxID=2614577 RepID=A0A9P7ZJ63_9HYPO|nr:uncharacterized protein F5Z01DRAFT_738180 [Emericellopsis atlantica]KAG9252696.1 hypothetical protein F5Z01DRAFT_738180 [Emericellopsis atlantica]
MRTSSCAHYSSAKFSDKYVLSASQTAWGWLLGQNLGRITFEVREPPPLIYNSKQLSATHCTVWITIKSHTFYLHRLRAGSIKVDPESSWIQPHTDTIQLNVHSFSPLQWSTRDVRRGGTVSAAPATTAEEESPPWHIAFNIPIKPPLKLPPSSAQKDSVHKEEDSRGLALSALLSSPEDNVCCTAVDTDVQCENDPVPPLYAA